MPPKKTQSEVQEELSRLESRYTLERCIGAGSYGLVFRAQDSETKKRVAIKRINNDIFEEINLAMRILREIKLLEHFHDDNIIGLIDIITPEDPLNFEHLYIVMDIMETDLRQVLRSSQVLTEGHIRFFIYQALRALRIIHSAGVIHRDITPANILVNTNCDLKICDFGLAKEEREQGEVMTDYVTMRWYRAPELVMVEKKYTTKIDVWGLGCILGELLGSRPLFPGKDRVNQLDKIVELLGTPSNQDLEAMGALAARKYIQRKENYPPVDWKARYPKASDEALDLLGRMLVFNPEHRITVEDAMRHPFFATIHDDSEENVVHAAFSFEERDYPSVADIKRAIYDESVKFHRNQTGAQRGNGTRRTIVASSDAPSVETTGEGRSAQQTIEKEETDVGLSSCDKDTSKAS